MVSVLEIDRLNGRSKERRIDSVKEGVSGGKKCELGSNKKIGEWREFLMVGLAQLGE